ncbi:hypothetical protein Patl1_12363 [Pistacia atlantica]|uniref:Uncharacterized protein n=1 Tax=Pistacia atlantica TaxID=434234 RepID=A0ACC1A4J7_9ROSI|nr:hypothetical protein Patl1_12363 [Pistacia atlantica]
MSTADVRLNIASEIDLMDKKDELVSSSSQEKAVRINIAQENKEHEKIDELMKSPPPKRIGMIRYHLVNCMLYYFKLLKM